MIDIKQLINFHDICHSDIEKARSSIDRDQLWYWIEKNHSYNCCLWAEEDLARRITVGADLIADNKRNIDGFNQKRNDAIEQIDEILLMRLDAYTLSKGAALNSETAGSIVDRLSIVSLKIYHMGLQAERKHVDSGHQIECRRKQDILKLQRYDLSMCLDDLIGQRIKGNRYFKIYRQYKMYNDAKLNPSLYNER